jgi:hypothetical protein
VKIKEKELGIILLNRKIAKIELMRTFSLNVGRIPKQILTYSPKGKRGVGCSVKRQKDV